MYTKRLRKLTLWQGLIMVMQHNHALLDYDPTGPDVVTPETSVLIVANVHMTILGTQYRTLLSYLCMLTAIIS